MRIYAMSKRKFDAHMEANGIDDSNVESFPNLYLISIGYTFSLGADDALDKMAPHFKDNHRNVLNITFDDVVVDMPYWDVANKVELTSKAMTAEQARTIADFVQNIEDEFLRNGKPTDDNEIIVHCHMGKSRSGAVAQFIAERFWYDQDLLMKDNPQIEPNRTCLRLLRETQHRK